MKLLFRLIIFLPLALAALAPVSLAQAQDRPRTVEPIWTNSESFCFNRPTVPANGQCDPVPSSYQPTVPVCVNNASNVLVVVKQHNGVDVCPTTGSWDRIYPAGWTGPGTPTGPGTGTGGGTTPGNPGNPVGTGVVCDFGTVDKGLCIPNNPICASGGTGVACSGNVTELISRVINILLYFAGIVAVVFVIIGGYMYMTSAGNTDRTTKGKATFVNAIIGLIIVILAYVAVRAITSFLTR